MFESRTIEKPLVRSVSQPDEDAYLCMIPIDPLWLSDLCVALSRAQTSAIFALHRPDSRRLFFADICC